jgi:glutaminase
MSTTSQHPVFRALDSQATGFISAEQILDKLAHGGIAAGDPRVVALREGLREVEDSQRINPEDFGALLQRAPSIVERVVKEELVIPQFANFAACIEDLHRECRKNRHGDVASYIPQLARVEPEQFGVAVCTIDGQRLTLGEADVPFSFQSSCKPILYCAALEEHGEDRVHRHIGREPSGFSFNELTLDKNGRPHNPMINAGAIISTSLLRPDLAMGERFDYLSHLVAALSGGSKPGFNNSMYHSERETADRNFALAHYMRELGAFPAGTDIFRTLDLYFGACSIETNATDMATVAATFENGGICPQSGERVFRDDTVKNCLSMMYSCGMYEYSGEFAFRVGVPAKSCVSGAILAVIPNVMGIAVWSPRLDEVGNSVRGLDFLQRLVATFNFHNYDSLVDSRKLDPRRRRQTSESNTTFSAIQAASTGDVDELKRLVAYGHDLDRADYDGRTPLHLAAAEGQMEAVRYLVNHGVTLSPCDRWNNTPLDDSRRHDHAHVAELLESRLAAQEQSKRTGGNRGVRKPTRREAA